MRSVLVVLAALPMFGGSALAAGPLSDSQLDRVTAGITLPIGLICGACNFSFSNSTSDNGVTTSSSGTTGSPAPGGGNPGGNPGGGDGGTPNSPPTGLQLTPAIIAALTGTTTVITH